MSELSTLRTLGLQLILVLTLILGIFWGRDIGLEQGGRRACAATCQYVGMTMDTDMPWDDDYVCPCLDVAPRDHLSLRTSSTRDR